MSDGLEVEIDGESVWHDGRARATRCIIPANDVKTKPAYSIHLMYRFENSSSGRRRNSGTRIWITWLCPEEPLPMPRVSSDDGDLRMPDMTAALVNTGRTSAAPLLGARLPGATMERDMRESELAVDDVRLGARSGRCGGAAAAREVDASTRAPSDGDRPTAAALRWMQLIMLEVVVALVLHLLALAEMTPRPSARSMMRGCVDGEGGHERKSDGDVDGVGVVVVVWCRGRCRWCSHSSSRHRRHDRRDAPSHKQASASAQPCVGQPRVHERARGVAPSRLPGDLALVGVRERRRERRGASSARHGALLSTS